MLMRAWKQVPWRIKEVNESGGKERESSTVVDIPAEVEENLL